MNPYIDDADFRLYVGDVRAVLRELPDASVDCCVTSPPYWGLRDYGTEGQIGLEASPEAFVAEMVAVFREVRRVLAPHGTLWLNLGDSYNNYDGGSYANDAREPGQQHGSFHLSRRSREVAEAREPRPLTGGLKRKDLVGIPWRVAFALQQPYYTGRITDERDRIWLAAMVDAEGCIHIHRRPAGQKTYSKFEKADGTTSEYVRKNDTYGVMVSIDNTSEAIIERCAQIVGQGARYKDPANSGVQQRRQDLHRITLTGQQSRALLRELYPYLVAKKQEARIAIACPSRGDEAARAHIAIKDLHNGRSTDVDYPPPEGMWERGWFLRSEIIWAKLDRTLCLNRSLTDPRNHTSRFSCSVSSRATSSIRRRCGRTTSRAASSGRSTAGTTSAPGRSAISATVCRRACRRTARRNVTT